MTPDALLATLDALEAQVVCYRRLAKLAEVQHRHVCQGQSDALMGVLRQRQAVLDEIAALEQALAPARKAWARFVSDLPDTFRPRADVALKETRRLLEQITTADQNDTLVLQQRKLNISREIKKTAVARRVNRNYAAAAYGRPESRMDLQQ
jgi:hypothetical protein